MSGWPSLEKKKTLIDAFFLSVTQAYSEMGLSTLCWHYQFHQSIVVIARQKNRALCWNNSAKFLRLFVLYKNFAETIALAQIPHFNTRPWLEICKNMAFSSSSSTTLSAAFSAESSQQSSEENPQKTSFMEQNSDVFSA